MRNFLAFAMVLLMGAVVNLAPELFRRIVLTLLIVLGCVLIAKALA